MPPQVAAFGISLAANSLLAFATRKKNQSNFDLIQESVLSAAIGTGTGAIVGRGTSSFATKKLISSVVAGVGTNALVGSTPGENARNAFMKMVNL